MKEAGGEAVGVAVFVGQPVWAHDDGPSPFARLIALSELGLLLTTGAALWLVQLTRTWYRDPAPAWAVAVGTIGLGAIATRPLMMVIRRRQREAHLGTSIVWRTAAVFAVLVGPAVVEPNWGVLLWIPVALVFGAEAALAAWAIGLPIDARAWYGRIVVSTLHLGTLGAVIASLLRLGWGEGRATVIRYFVSFHLLVILVCVTAAVLDRVYQLLLAASREQIDATIAAEHRTRAHWLHDDVSSQLRIVSLKVQDGNTAPDEVVALLDDLDHTIRLRQLDEVLASGTATLAEIIQPYVRVAQSHGAMITDVPSFESASLAVSSATGRLVARATSVFTTNALQAGATAVGYELRHDGSTVTVQVSDNAGGFNLEQAPAGRALWQLSRELDGRVRSRRGDDGTTMTAEISMEVRARGEAVAG